MTDNSAGAGMHAVAAKLRTYGFVVRLPESSDSRRMTVTNAKNARSEITVEDRGNVTWDYWPGSGSNTDLADIVGLIAIVLGPLATDTLPDTDNAEPLVSAAGHALDVLGLEVTTAGPAASHPSTGPGEITAFNPAVPFNGKVRVTNDGRVTWECHPGDSPTECALAVADTTVAVLAHGIEGLRHQIQNSTLRTWQ